MKVITIKKTKGIQSLAFALPEKHGVYLLVGANGAGKSTLLVCLHRLCCSWAFAEGFKSSRFSGIDQYSDSSIIYTVNADQVIFRKRSERWVPTPRNKSNLLNGFGFTSSVFIQADSKRFEPKQQDVREGRLVSADSTVCQALNEIFETTKYSSLQRLRNAYGRGRTTVFFYVIPHGATRYTEKRFSSGELAVIRLLEQLHIAQQNTLFLLDEAEMALHPRVQRNLLQYIKRVAEEKNLTVFISTHSATMINMTGKDNIFLLKTNPDGSSEIIPQCYPANAIGSVDFIENAGFDYLFFVEDDMAKILLKKMIKKYVGLQPEHATSQYCVTPVGGLKETAKFAIETKRRLFADSKVFALLDEDAFQGDTPRLDDIRAGHEDTVRNLGYTPEVYFIDKLETADDELANTIRTDYRCEVCNILRDEKYAACQAQNPRKLAKKKFEVLVDILHSATGNSEDVVIDRFIEMIVRAMSSGDIMRILNPIFAPQ